MSVWEVLNELPNNYYDFLELVYPTKDLTPKELHKICPRPSITYIFPNYYKEASFQKEYITKMITVLYEISFDQTVFTINVNDLPENNTDPYKFEELYKLNVSMLKENNWKIIPVPQNDKYIFFLNRDFTKGIIITPKNYGNSVTFYGFSSYLVSHSPKIPNLLKQHEKIYQ